jgi:hypothetical protein|nr:MAG TPA: Protein of unknown function (DUF3102) [Caudoviricetes sp.]
MENLEENKNIILRPIETIECEINFYKQQTASGIIEIGKRLIEAKEQLDHGLWGKWLKEKVNFNERTAQNFMKAAKEYSNTNALADLGQTKIFTLLEVPAEERENFINVPHEVDGKEKKVDEMTTRELKKVIDELKKEKAEKEEALQKADEASKELEKSKQASKVMEKELSDFQKKNSSLSKEIDKIKNNLNKDLEKEKEKANKRITEYQNENKELEDKIKELKEKPIEVVGIDETKIQELEDKHKLELEKLMKEKEEIENKLKEEQKKKVIDNSDLTEYAFHFEIITDEVNKLIENLYKIEEKRSKEDSEKYKKATCDFLETIIEDIKS